MKSLAYKEAKYIAEFRVNRLHVSEPESRCVEIAEKLAGLARLTRKQTASLVASACKVHEANRRTYRAVMSGML